ncbi:MAG: 2Fe-2S iron-sulfur cluster binding domain-containing protein [Phycisphaerae bacterium]|nr:2Fe-2S iron-sulfur cluster binding domain-containing protein [Phycisphaerae bacterium]
MFSTFIISVLVVSGIGAGLAAVLAIAEYFVANYGQCKITVNEEKEITVEGGGNLLSALANEKIFIPSACGGRGTCGLCKLKVLEGAGQILPTEEPYMTKEEIADNVRLSCQVKVRNDLKILIPKKLLAIQEYKTKCAKIIDLTSDIRLFRLELLEPVAMDYVPGRYVQFFAPKYDGSNEEAYRAYSIASNPAQKNIIELIIRLVPKGICTTYCFNFLKEGDDVKINGPYGEFGLRETDADIVFIAGGSGIAPIRCILFDMKNTGNKRKATFYFGANTVAELCLVDEMKQFEKDMPNFKFVPVVAHPAEGENWKGETGLVTEAVRRNEKTIAQCEAYLCGSPGMIDASIKVLTSLGMSEEKIYYDKFA